jgi:small-conductance mechanosensitive channel
MDEQQFQSRLQEMLDEIKGLDVDPATKQKLTQHAQESHERFKKTRDAVQQMQDSLDHLRISVKYLVFDLEATRRENKVLRAMLGQGEDLGPGEEADDG